MSQCEARTAKGARCRCEGTTYRLVEYSDGAREFLVCKQHATAILQGQPFRPAVHRDPVKKENAA
ncbi:MAG: hypothetical protein RBU21_19410 [FCB group bacterium]|jgi:hypothetical protein|nr:hypothetical protein [FCB group bacterium]